MKDKYSWEELEVSESEISVDIRNSKANSVRIKKDKKASVRVIRDNFVGIGAAKGEYSLDVLKEKALDSLLLGMKADFDFPADKTGRFEKGTFEITPEQAFSAVEQLLSKIKHPDYILSNNIKFKNMTISIRNSNNTDLSFKTGCWRAGVVFKHKDSMGIMDGIIGDGGTGNYDFSDMIERVPQYFNAFETPLSFKDMFGIDSGESKTSSDEKGFKAKLPVLLIHAEDHFFSKLMREFTGREYHRGTTIFNKSLGKKIFHEDITIVDSCSPESNSIYMPFDMEGTLRNDPELVMIENGVFKNLAYDLKNARKYNAEPSGNGFRGITSNGSTSFTDLSLRPGSRSIEELTENPVVMPFVCAGGDILDNGDYSTPVQLGFVVHKGRVIGRLPEFTMHTSLKDAFLNDFTAVSSERWYPRAQNPAMLINAVVSEN
jgi:predicted Zn-dependent protease